MDCAGTVVAPNHCGLPVDESKSSSRSTRRDPFMEEPTLQRVDTDAITQSSCIPPDAESDRATRTRWFVLLIVCLGALIDMLDTTVANVALPTIRTELGFSDDSLVWIVNAFMVAYGGFLILGGRTGDHYGHLRVFLIGIALFSVASIICGIATVGWFLIIGRCIQGLSAAAVLATSLPVILQQFPAQGDRTRALAIYTGALSIAGSVGVFLGGVLTQTLGWRWIFFINVGIGVVALLLRRQLRVSIDPGRRSGRLDVSGAITLTISATLATLAALNVTRSGWWAGDTILPLCGALVSGVLFLLVERRTQVPLMSLELFALPNFRVAIIVSALHAAGQCIWFLVSALQLQRVLGYTAGSAGLAFLPATLTGAVVASGLSAKLVGCFGARATLILGLLLNALGLGLLARMPVDAVFAKEILPAMVLVGMGNGFAVSPLNLCAMRGVREGDYGAASGLMTSCAVMVGALAMASAASLGAMQTERLLAVGTAATQALNSGYQIALAGAAFSVTAACFACVWMEET